MDKFKKIEFLVLDTGESKEITINITDGQEYSDTEYVSIQKDLGYEDFEITNTRVFKA